MKTLKILLAALAFISMPAISANASDITEGDDDIIPIYIAGDGDSLERQKAPALIPISAAYHSSTSQIEVTLIRNVGLVDVRIQNYATGSTVDSSILPGYIGIYSIPAPTATGTYIITFTLASGRRYFGMLYI